MMSYHNVRAGLSAAIISVGLCEAAQAAIVGTETDYDLSNGPVTFDIDGQASYTFSDSGEVGGFSSAPLPAVATGGSAGVNTNPSIFGGGIATYFSDPARRPFIDGALLGSGFQSSPEPGTIDAQIPVYIALELTWTMAPIMVSRC